MDTKKDLIINERIENINRIFDSDTNVGDTISRQAALDIFDDYNVAVENGQIEAYSRDRKRLCDLPPVTPKQRTGKWIKADVCGDITSWECTSCHNWTGLPTGWNVWQKLWICPKCGAKMEGVSNEGD